MNGKLLWIFILVIHCAYVTSRPAQSLPNAQDTDQRISYNADNGQVPSPNPNKEQVISVRITSSVAVGRGKGKSTHKTNENDDFKQELTPVQPTDSIETENKHEHKENYADKITNLPSTLEGANIEYIKQINAKKETKEYNGEQIHPYKPSVHGHYNDTDKLKERDHEDNNEKHYEYIEDAILPQKSSMPESHADSHKEHNNYGSFSILDDAIKFSEEHLNPSTQSNTRYSTSDIGQILDTNKNDERATNDFKQQQNTYNETDDSIAEPSIKSVLELLNRNEENYENIENVPLARSLLQSPSSKNYIQGYTNKPPSEREPSTRLTTVSFNVVHDAPKITNSFGDHARPFANPTHIYNDQQKYFETQKIYSQPAQIYSEPAKFYSEPAKIYSEPAKIYSEPAKIYSEPAKIYSEPSKFYSEPASLHLNTNYLAWQHSQAPPTTTVLNTTPITTNTISDVTNTQKSPDNQAEKKYEVDEKVSVQTDGRSHGVQESTTEKCKQDSCKVGYVVKGREFNKYRVEERTSDGFIVGEYGVVRNEDGALRGVRYTADSEASPRLIYDALMKFLQLK